MANREVLEINTLKYVRKQLKSSYPRRSRIDISIINSMGYGQVVVVEGKHDEQKLDSIFPGIECIVTNGSSISKDTLNLIYQTSLKREVILFLDPDFPGRKITNEILQTNGSFQIAFINKENAKSKNNKKVGIEHASKEEIIKSLNMVYKIEKNHVTVTYKDLADRKLINHSDSRNRRLTLCKCLNIGFSNGKTLLKNLNMLGITLERIDSVIGK